MAYSKMGTIPWGGEEGGAENAERGRIKPPLRSSDSKP